MSAIAYRLRIRNAGNSADALTVTSVAGGTNPYLTAPPSCDGNEFGPFTGDSRAGEYVFRIADAIKSGTDRVITSQLEDADFRQQLLDRLAYGEFSTDGGSTWSVLAAAYVTRVEAVTDVEYEIAISDPARLEKGVTVFAPRQAIARVSGTAAIGATSVPVDALTLAMPAGTVLHFNTNAVTVTANAAIGATSLTVSALTVGLSAGDASSYTESLADYVVRWPNRGCVFGGPVLGGFGPVKDLGGIEMKAIDRTTAAGHKQTFLQFYAGFVYPGITPASRTTRAVDVATPVNKATQSRWRGLRDDADLAQAAITTFDAARNGSWGDLLVEVIGHGYFQPVAHTISWQALGGTRADPQRTYDLFSALSGWQGLFIGGNDITIGSTILRVRAFTAEPSDLSPIYWDGHPLDLLDRVWTEAGIPHDASAAAWTTLRSQLGSDLSIALRITQSQDLASFLQNVVYGPWGVGVRPTTDGKLEPFATRIFANTPPTDTITDTTVAEGTTTPFRLDAGTAIKRVVFEQTRLVADTQQQALDGFVAQDERIERTNGDPNSTGTGELTFTIPGMVHTLGAWTSILDKRVDAIAAEVFDRAGRGLVEGETFVVRGQGLDSLVLGQEVLVDLPQIPNHNKRLGDDGAVAARAMQIVRMTPDPNGWHVKLADSGPNAQPVPTVPTLSLAASASSPRAIAEATITNAATLNAAGYAVRLQIASAVGGAPATTAYTDLAYYAAGQVPTGAITLPPVVAGSTVGVRARSEAVGSRPSNWQTPVTLALTTIDAPTGVGVNPDPVDASRALVAWTVGANASADLTDVSVRLAPESASQAVRRAQLPAGSDSYELDGLTAGVAYVAAAQHRDPASGDVSALVEASFTAGSTVNALAAPEDPWGFAGTQDPALGLATEDGTYGLAVAAVEFPGTVEFYEALETSPGSGTFGTAASVASLPAVQGNWTVYQSTAANDGLARQLTARHVVGATTSSFTDAVNVTPWRAQPLAPFATATGVYALRNFRKSAEDITTRTYSWERGALVAFVWVYLTTLPLNSATDPWPDPNGSTAPTDRLAAGTDTLVLTKPADGYRLYAQIEARDADLNVHQVRRIEVNPKSALAVTVTPTEGSGTATLTVVVTDPASMLAAVNPVQFRVTRDQTVSFPVSPSTTVGSTYTRNETLDDKHVVRIEPVLNLADGSSITLSAYTFDSDLIAEVVNATVAYADLVATVTIQFDTDCTVGAGRAEYSTNGGSTWNSLTVASDETTSFTIAQTTAKQTILVRGYHGTTAGPSVPVEVDKLPSLPVVAKAVRTSSSATQIVVSVSATDPVPQGGSSYITITPTPSGCTVTPSTPQSVASGGSVSFTIDRPSAGSGPARVDFTTSAANREDDHDSVDVPDQAPTLPCVVKSIAWSSTDYTADSITLAFALQNPPASGTVRFNRSTDSLATITLAGSATLAATSFTDSSTGFDLISTTGPKVTFWYQAEVRDGSSNIVAQSAWITRTEAHA